MDRSRPFFLVTLYRPDFFLYGMHEWLNSFRFGNANYFADVIACTHKQVIAYTLTHYTQDQIKPINRRSLNSI